MEQQLAAPGGSEIADLSSQDAQTVCEALGRYEDTLRGAVREIHADIAVFKRGVERQLEDALRLAGPLPRIVSDLQQENRGLRAQVQRLAQQVERLARCLALPDDDVTLPGSPGIPAGNQPGSPCTPGGTFQPGSPCTPGGNFQVGFPCTPGGTFFGSPGGNLPGSPCTPGGILPGSPCASSATLPGSPCTPGGSLPSFSSPGGSIPGSPSTPRTRFSSHALLSVSGKSQRRIEEEFEKLKNVCP